MSDIDGSFIKVPIERVQEQCRYVLEEIPRRRKKRDEEILTEEMKDYVWWAKYFGWLGYKVPTREELHDILKEEQWYRYPSELGRVDLTKAKTLLDMTSDSVDGYVLVGRNDYHEIFVWYKKPKEAAAG